MAEVKPKPRNLRTNESKEFTNEGWKSRLEEQAGCRED